MKYDSDRKRNQLAPAGDVVFLKGKIFHYYIALYCMISIIYSCRFSGVVQGKELDTILKNEGVIGPEEEEESAEDELDEEQGEEEEEEDLENEENESDTIPVISI